MAAVPQTALYIALAQQNAAQQQAQYQQWLQQNQLREDPTYDMAGAFRAGLNPDANGHMPDTFKLPTHPTFSDESQYSGNGGPQGGRWIGHGNRWTFMASPHNVQNMPKEQLMDYFDRVEPGNTIQFPDGTAYVGGSRK